MYNAPISCLCTQESMETEDYKRICNTILKETASMHRKQWEFAYIIRMLELTNKLKPGSKGLGFGCGQERLVPALASQDVELLVTDLNVDAATQKGWVATNQHSQSLQGFQSYIPEICSQEQLNRCSYRTVDMTKIPHDLMQMKYDFVWSSCSLEHVGTMGLAKQFIYSTIHCLKPGGVAIHTTEYNISSNRDTLLEGATVLFRKQDILEIETEAEKIDGLLAPMSFLVGRRPLDKYIDMPPYLGSAQRKHLKLRIDKYNCTSIGLCIQRRK